MFHIDTLTFDLAWARYDGLFKVIFHVYRKITTIINTKEYAFSQRINSVSFDKVSVIYCSEAKLSVLLFYVIVTRFRNCG